MYADIMPFYFILFAFILLFLFDTHFYLLVYTIVFTF